MAYCDRCDRDFPSQRSLMQHISSNYNHDWCDVCFRDFPNPRALEQHRKSSSNHHYCQQCDKEFVSANGLKTHYINSSAHSYCKDCERFFQNDHQLSQHLRSALHVGRKIACAFCDRSFPTAGALTLHLESNTCRSGITRQNLNDFVQRHDRNHIVTDRLIEWNGPSSTVETWATDAAWNGSNYECYFCNRQFRLLSALNNHLKSPAHEQKIYRCPKCQTRFVTLSGLVQHVESESCGVAKFQGVMEFTNGLSANMKRMLTF
ncbi:hypothetical protein RUND412_010022 [Rhizina undulata]